MWAANEKKKRETLKVLKLTESAFEYLGSVGKATLCAKKF
jgi:hypothetical protein